MTLAVIVRPAALNERDCPYGRCHTGAHVNRTNIARDIFLSLTGWAKAPKIRAVSLH